MLCYAIPSKSHLEFMEIEKHNLEAAPLACRGVAWDFVGVMHAGKVAQPRGYWGMLPPRTFLNLGSWKCDSGVFHRIFLINKINTQENEVINCLFYPSLVSLVR